MANLLWLIMTTTKFYVVDSLWQIHIFIRNAFQLFCVVVVWNKIPCDTSPRDILFHSSQNNGHNSEWWSKPKTHNAKATCVICKLSNLHFIYCCKQVLVWRFFSTPIFAFWLEDLPLIFGYKREEEETQ